jgi:class 3 adenylate cyclase
MVLFNDPIPCPEPALRAVKMAIEIRACIGEISQQWSKQGHDLGFGVGIAQGFATLGRIGFEGRSDYAAIGTVPNLASRLCDEAKTGQILISQRVHSAIEEFAETETLGVLSLKGLTRPVPVYNVRSLKKSNSSTE